MNEERLWAPWRLGYLRGEDIPTKPPTPTGWVERADHDCFLCQASATYAQPAQANQTNLVVQRGALSVALLNRYPYSNGHLLVSPIRHVSDLADLTEDEHLEIMRTLMHFEKELREKACATGFNIGLNLGADAGAGVPGHLHWHLVPRWPGDHNFMATLAGVRVIPQSLEEMWTLLQTDSKNP